MNHCDRFPFLGCSLPAGERLVVIGAGGHARVLISAIQQAGATVSGVYDDDPAKWGREVLQVPVLGAIRELQDAKIHVWVIGVGDNVTRRQIAARFPSAEWLTVIHPQAYVHESASLGPGTVVFAGAVVQPGVRIGRHCIIQPGTLVP